MIKFVEEKEGLAFPDAVEALADRYGVELEREQEDPRAEEQRKARARLQELLERTAGFYATFLRDAPQAVRAREYLAERGLGEEVLADFGVGCAPGTWDTVLASRPAGRLLGRGDRGRGAGARRARRARGTTTAFARGSCSRFATRAGGCRGSARGRCCPTRSRST